MSDMLSVEEGFQYSVNIAYDLYTNDKLSSFIPTNSSIILIKDVIKSTFSNYSDRARILIGAYGKGKSHIVLTILSLLMKKDLSFFKNLLPVIEEDEELRNLVTEYYSCDTKLLPVIISGSNTSVSQAFLIALQKTLSENNLTEIMPETNYMAAVNVIDRWKEEFPDVYSSFSEMIDRPVEVFKSNLKEYSIETYEQFEKVFPSLSAGSVFNPFLGFDVVELYESVAKSLKSKGYSGIYVIYDEFSKYLETNIRSASVSDTKMLQDFAEKCNRSNQAQLHVMLISHKEISNYIDKLPKQKVDGWRGVSERFKHVHLSNNFSQIYEIIGTVIKKDEDKWEKFKKNNNNSFTGLDNRYRNHLILSDIDSYYVDKCIYDCYPLHPISTFILPRLSEKIAQNERTLFTFLSSKGNSTLVAFLDKYDDRNFKLITPDVIFDYFELLLKKEAYNSDIHKLYILTRAILDKLMDKSLENRIVKTISLIYMVEQYDKLRPVVEELIGIYSFEYSYEEIKTAIDNLIFNEYVLYLKQSNDFLRLKQSSGIDIEKTIDDYVERIRGNESVKDTLNSSGPDNFMYPSRYNNEREMTRFFDFRFINSDEIKEDTDWELKSENVGADGVVYGIIPSEEAEVNDIIKLLCATSENKHKFIFIVPRNKVEIEEKICRYKAVISLKKDAENVPVLFDEYEVMYEDLDEVIREFIRGYTRPEMYSSVYIFNGKKYPLTRRSELSELMSKICDRVYSKTPVVNNEMINKSKISTIAVNSRSKVIAGLLREKLEPGLGLRGSGQEVSIMRSTLVRTNILREDNSVVWINLDTGDENMDFVLETIDSFVKESSTVEKNFGELYSKLTKSEFGIGLRKGIIPIYIAAIFHNYKKDIMVYHGDEECLLDADTLLLIDNKPDEYKLKIINWTEDSKDYIEKLDRLFINNVIDAERGINSYDYLFYAIKRWYMSLPKYSRELPGDKIFRSFIRDIKRSDGGYELLFERFPKDLNPSGAVDEKLIQNIILSKEFFDNRLQLLREHMITNVKNIFSLSQEEKILERSSLKSVLMDWRDTLKNESIERLYSSGSEKILRAINESTNDEYRIIDDLARIVTGLRMEDWDEQTSNAFLSRLKSHKNSIEEYNDSLVEEDTQEIAKGDFDYSVSYVGEDGKIKTKRFDKVEKSGRGKLLMNSITGDIEAMGQSIQISETRQILMDILQSLM
ncbi:MAG: restriction endonuclease subunit S [Eubacterium sp.]|nr:restriction endonuclease subunit S [Eubacterium sp.]